MLSRQEHPLATFQGSTVRAWLTGETLAAEHLFISVAQDVLCPESKGAFVSFLSLRSPIKTGTLHLATGL